MIREYQHSDWLELKALYERSLKEWLDLSKYPVAVYSEVTTPLTEGKIKVGVVYVDNNERLSGLLIGGAFIGNCLFVYDFYVVPELRATAIPGRMYALFESLALGKGYEHIVFETSPYHKDFIELLKHTGCRLCKLQFVKELQ